MPRKNRASRINRREQNRKADRLTVRWLSAITSTPGFRPEDVTR